MLKIIRILFLVLCFNFISLAQNQPNVVFWSNNAECGSKKIVDQLNFTCTQFVEHKEQVRVIKSNEIILTVKFFNTRRDVKAYLIIENLGEVGVNINPTTWKMHQYKNRKSFLSGNPPNITTQSRLTFTDLPVIKLPVLGSPSSQTSQNDRAISNTRTDQNANPINRQQFPSDGRTYETLPPVSGGGIFSFPTPKKNKSDELEETIFHLSPLSSTVLAQSESVKGVTYFRYSRLSKFQLLIITIENVDYAFELTK